jgi:hypothetical protein
MEAGDRGDVGLPFQNLLDRCLTGRGEPFLELVPDLEVAHA